MEIVKISVGDSKNPEVFQVHKKFFCGNTPYFDKMFNGNFRECIDQSATFPEDEPRIWKLLIGWLYKGTIEFPTGSPNSHPRNQAVLAG
jgi:hypothetical protein